MGRSRLVKSNTVRIAISDGDWIDVHRRLNAGEQRKVYDLSRGPDGPEGELKIDRVRAGIATVIGYLVDWSFGEADPSLAIRYKPEAVPAAIDAIDHQTFVEILRAIEAHEAAMQAERTAEKNVPAGAITSDPISPLPSGPE